MSQPRTIALDAMGGDHGPPVVVAGAAISLERYPSLSFLFFGDEVRIASELEKFPALAAKSHVVHTATTIGMSDKPSQALRRAFAKNLFLQVYIAEGFYDAATPYFAVDYTFNHMGLNPEMHKNISWSYYPAGHMLYIDSDSHAKLKHDVKEFLAGAIPKDIQ